MNGIQGFYVGGRTEIGTQKQKKSTVWVVLTKP